MILRPHDLTTTWPCTHLWKYIVLACGRWKNISFIYLFIYFIYLFILFIYFIYLFILFIYFIRIVRLLWVSISYKFWCRFLDTTTPRILPRPTPSGTKCRVGTKPKQWKSRPSIESKEDFELHADSSILFLAAQHVQTPWPLVVAVRGSAQI